MTDKISKVIGLLNEAKKPAKQAEPDIEINPDDCDPECDQSNQQMKEETRMNLTKEMIEEMSESELASLESMIKEAKTSNDEGSLSESEADLAISVASIMESSFVDWKLNESTSKALFESTEFAEEFKTKAVSMFESAVNEKVREALTESTGKVVSRLNEESTKYRKLFEAELENLDQDLGTFAESVAQKWLKENQIAVEHSLRLQIMENFASGMRKLLADSYIDVPADKVDIVESMADRITQMEAKINEAMAETVEAKKALTESQKEVTILKLMEGKTVVQAAKIRQLAEEVEFKDPASFGEKLSKMFESSASTPVAAKTGSIMLNEGKVPATRSDKITPMNESSDAARIAAYANHLAKVQKNRVV